MDQIRAISVFVAVVERGSFASAADHLGLSRTAASKHVMDLEAHLGVSLLARTTRRVSLTQPGTAYFERAKRILEEIEAANNEAATQTQTPHGKLRVSAPMSFGIRHIAPRLKGYLQRYPDVRIDLSLNDRQVDLIEEGFDLTVRIGRLQDSSLMVRGFATSRLITCASPDYLREYGRPTHPHDLKRHRCLGYSYQPGPAEWTYADPDGLTVSVPVDHLMWCNNGDALLNAAASGLGIVLQPDFIVHEALASGELVGVLEGYTAPEIGIHVLYGRTEFMPLRIRTFIDFLIESFKDDTPWSTRSGRGTQ